MNNFPTKDIVIESVKKGIYNAKDNFTFWTTDELSLSYAPPKFLSVHIAQELSKLEFPPEIFIDASVSDVLRCSLPDRNEYKSFMKEKKLTQDIIHLTLDERFVHKNDNDSVSRVIMTIQNGVRSVQAEYIKDIEKMCKMIERKNKNETSIDYAVFAFYMDIFHSARIKSERRLNEIIDSFDDVVENHQNLKAYFKGGEVNVIENIGEWCVGFYIIEPSK